MQTKEHPRDIFADALIRMLETMPLEKVRVTALCKHCGMAPATFYYYFQDKYDLVAWIYLQDISYGSEGGIPDFSPRNLFMVNQRIKKRKTFYQKAFSDQSQNSLREYMQSFMIRGARETYAAVTGREMTRPQLLEVKYYVVGTIGLFQEWLTGTDLELEDIAWLVADKAPEFLKKLYDGMPAKKDTATQAQ